MKIDIKRNYEIIREVCTTYRKELTIFSAVIGEYYAGFDKEEYINFMNDLPLETFIGNFLNALYNNDTIKLYMRLLEIHDFISWIKEISIGPNIKREIIKYLCD